MHGGGGGGGWWAYLRYDESKGQPKVDRSLLRRVSAWARPYALQLVAMVGLLLAIALVELAPPLLYGELVRALDRDMLTLGRLNQLAFWLLAAPVVSSLLSVAQRHVSARSGEGLIYDLRLAMYRHMQRMGLRFFTDTKTGDIMSRFNNDVVGAQTALTGTIPNLITNVLTLVTTLGLMLGLEWRMTVLAVAVLPVFLLPTRRVGLLLRSIRREAATHDARLSSQVQETMNVSGAMLVRTFGQQEDVTARFADVAASVREIGVRRAVVGRWFFFGLGIAAAIGTALMYWMGGFLALGGDVDAGKIVSFAALVPRLYQPIIGLSNIQVEFVTSLVSFERVFEYLDMRVEVPEPDEPVPLSAVRGRIEFDHVWFGYREDPFAVGDQDGGRDPGPATWSLADVTFVAEPGQVVALVGPSGAGKTTVTYLVARLYDPSRGRITLDGRDLRDLAHADLAEHVGMVTQEAYLFHDTVKANLLFARPGASHDELVAACRAANVHDVVESMPEGYDTIVGERGYRMSGGEKQRLALARVILKDPSVLVLDEATSHLDSHSEALIQDALERVMRGRTSLVIAHRLSTILAADQILVFDRGRIVEGGTHERLLDAGGLYASLYRTQFRQPHGTAAGVGGGDVAG